MEHIFPPKTIALVPNATVTINWTASDIAQRFVESVIKRPVAIRFSCATTCINSVNCGVRYSTLTKDYLVAERRTLFFIPPSGSVDVTPASKPALGMLNRDIVSFSLDLTAPGAGNVTITLIIDDDPPPLSSEAGELIGLDAKFAQDYILINMGGVSTVLPPGGTPIYSYSVPAGKRAIIRAFGAIIPATPVGPGLLALTFALTLAGFAITYYSLDNELFTVLVTQFDYILQSGETFSASFINSDTTNYVAFATLLAEEIF